MDLSITPAIHSEKAVLRRLLELYLYDFSEFTGGDLDEHGLFGYRYLDHYWTEPDRLPFLLRVEGKLAGFALVRRPDADGVADTLDMAEFFVLRKYRRAGVGRQAALALFSALPGRWEVRETAENLAAQAFWRAVIAEHTSGRFNETTWSDNDGSHGPMQTFVSGS
jgi:predicted acetyltransferase